MIKTNNIRELRLYKDKLDSCIAVLMRAIRHGTFGYYHEADLTFAIGSDNTATEKILLRPSELQTIRDAREAERDEIAHKIEWLEDLAENTANRMDQQCSKQ